MTRRSLLTLLALCLLLPAAPVAKASPQGLSISEVLAGGRLSLVEGRLCDWVELHNGGPGAIDLSGYGLSDRPSLPFKARLKGSIGPGEYKVFPADDLGLGFSLAKEGETIRLTAPDGALVDQLSYPPLPLDASYAHTTAGWQVTHQPTPGAANLVLSKAQVETARHQHAASFGLVISELMAANASYLANRPNEDWVELHNLSGKAMSLQGLYLSDSADDLKKYAFPRRAELGAGRRALVYCTGEAMKLGGAAAYVNPSFRLEKSGGALILSDGENIIDCLSWDSQYGSVSYGRPEGQGSFAWFNQQSPLQPNPATGLHEQLEPVHFSTPGGFVAQAFSLSLSAAPGASIHYSLDGSLPGEASPRYEGPLTIADSQVVRAVALQPGKLDAPVASHSYLFDQRPDVATVCLSGPRAVFFGGRGMFSPGNDHMADEHPVAVEIYQADSSLRQLVGMKLTGGTSQAYLPRAFTLYGRSGLGAGRMAINPFPDRVYQDYDALTLRGGGTDAGRTRIRDAFLCTLAQGYGVMYLSNAPAMVYVNGAFYAAMDLRERANQAAIAQWEGIRDKDLIRQINIVKNRGVEQQGSKADLDALAAYCRRYDLNQEEHLQRVLSWLDVDSLFAHSAFEIITGNSDIGNVRYYQVPGGKWKLMLFDLDLGMLQPGRSPLEHFVGNGRSATRFFYGELFQALMQVPQMQDKFFSLCGRILAERFAPGYLLPRLDSWQTQYRPLFKRHAQAWPDFSLAKWDKSMERFQAMLIRRPPAVVKYLRAAYKLSPEQVEHYFGDFLATLPESP